MYEPALALRKLNDNPNFSESLDPSIGLKFTKRTLLAVRQALAGGLTDEQRAALTPTMALSWLHLDSYHHIIKNTGQVALPLDKQFHDGAPNETLKTKFSDVVEKR
jgi:hypothetical protein